MSPQGTPDEGQLGNASGFRPVATVVSACLVFLQGLTGTANFRGRSDRAPVPSGTQGPKGPLFEEH